MSKTDTTTPKRATTPAKTKAKSVQPRTPSAQSQSASTRKQQPVTKGSRRTNTDKKKPDGNPTVNPSVSARKNGTTSRQTKPTTKNPTVNPKGGNVGQPAETVGFSRVGQPSPAAQAPASKPAEPQRPLFQRASVTLTVSADVPRPQPGAQERPSAAPGASASPAQAPGPAMYRPAPQAGGTPGTPRPADVPAQEAPDPRDALEYPERRFCFEYAQDGNATRAYMRATGTTRIDTAGTMGSRWLQRVEIRGGIERERLELQARTGVTTEKLVAKLWAIASADPRELVEYFIESCRYCHGVGHLYQRTDAEFERDRREFETFGRQRIGGVYLSAKVETQRRASRRQHGEPEEVFEEQGGPGYDAKLPPHPHCPSCAGHGRGRTVIKDSRELTYAGAALYAGVKEGKEGIEVKMHSQMEAVEKLARILGSYEADNRQKALDPFAELLGRVMGPQAGIPVVDNPPEDTAP